MAEDFGELVASTVRSFSLHSADQAPQEATQEAPQEATQEEAPQEETKHDTMDSSAPKQSADGDKEAPQEATQEAHLKDDENEHWRPPWWPPKPKDEMPARMAAPTPAPMAAARPATGSSAPKQSADGDEAPIPKGMPASSRRVRFRHDPTDAEAAPTTGPPKAPPPAHLLLRLGPPEQASGLCPPQSADGDIEAQPAETQNSTAQATGSSPPQSADGDRVVTLSLVQQELELLQKLPEWITLQQVIKDNLSDHGRVGTARQALSQHTTVEISLISLKIPLNSAGLDIKIPANGGFKVIVSLPCAYEITDGLAIHYESPVMQDFGEAQNKACMDILSFLLAVAPQKVRLHPSNWKNGMDTMLLIRVHASYVHATHMMSADGDRPFSSQIYDPMYRPPMYRPPSQPSQHGQIKYDESNMASVPADGSKELKALTVLSALKEGTKFNASKLPEFIWSALDGILEKNELLPFMQKHPNRFQILRGSGGTWQFKVGEFHVPADGGADGGAPAPPPPPPPPAAKAKTIPAMPTRPVPVPSASGVTPPPGLMPGSSKDPANGGVASWRVQDVILYLQFLELPHLSDLVIQHAVDGPMLLELIRKDELLEVGFSKLQARKITQRLPSR